MSGAAGLVVGLAIAASCIAPRHGATAPEDGIPLSWTEQQCRTPARDRDADGVDDDCELALARGFAPEMIVDPRDCAWDATVSPAQLGGGYLFAVQRGPNQSGMRIAYLPAYFRDCGWEGAPCLTRRAGCSAHAGDSEIVVVQVRQAATTRRWQADAVFLSAHCFGRSDGRCGWYTGQLLRHFEWVDGAERGAPRVWVAKGKHANYPSARQCDSGHWYYDSCDGNGARYRFPIAAHERNIGSRHRPLPTGDGGRKAGCIAAEQLLGRSTAVDARAQECFWAPRAPFRGWQRTATGTSPSAYADVLRFAAQF